MPTLTCYIYCYQIYIVELQFNTLNNRNLGCTAHPHHPASETSPVEGETQPASLSDAIDESRTQF